MPFLFSEKDLDDDEVLCQKLLDLSSIVYSRHFYVNNKEKEDLLSVGVVKGLSLVREGNFNPKKGKLVTFLYTGIRNEMHNYIYRISREIISESACEGVKSDSSEEYSNSFLQIDYGLVQNVCTSFTCYGDLSDFVVDNLKRMGFDIPEYIPIGDKPAYTFYPYGAEFYGDLVNRVTGAVLWKSLESYL